MKCSRLICWFQNEKCTVSSIRYPTEDKRPFFVNELSLSRRKRCNFPKWIFTFPLAFTVLARYHDSADRVAYLNSDMSSVIAIIRTRFWFCTLRFFLLIKPRLKELPFRDARHAIAFRDDNLFLPVLICHFRDHATRRGNVHASSLSLSLPLLSSVTPFLSFSLFFSRIHRAGNSNEWKVFKRRVRHLLLVLRDPASFNNNDVLAIPLCRMKKKRKKREKKEEREKRKTGRADGAYRPATFYPLSRQLQVHFRISGGTASMFQC